MKRLLIRVFVVAVVAGFLFSGGVAFAKDDTGTWGKFNQGTQGKAKEGLEDTAGKKTGDVKVPDVPPPTPAKKQ